MSDKTHIEWAIPTQEQAREALAILKLGRDVGNKQVRLLEDFINAQPPQAAEPVAWRTRNINGAKWTYRDRPTTSRHLVCEPLYATPTPAIGWKTIKSDHVPSRLRDAALLSASWQPVTPWAKVDQEKYLQSVDCAYDKMANDPTVRESLTVHPDDIAVDRFAIALKAKMKYAREVKGRGGWDDPHRGTVLDLKFMLQEHIEKGDMIDIGNFAMMIWNRDRTVEVESIVPALLSASPEQGGE